MAKFLMEYKHIEETTYEEWVEADTEEEAFEKVENGDVDFTTEIGADGTELIDVIHRISVRSLKEIHHKG